MISQVNASFNCEVTVVVDDLAVLDTDGIFSVGHDPPFRSTCPCVVDGVILFFL